MTTAEGRYGARMEADTASSRKDGMIWVNADWLIELIDELEIALHDMNEMTMLLTSGSWFGVSAYDGFYD